MRLIYNTVKFLTQFRKDADIGYFNQYTKIIDDFIAEGERCQPAAAREHFLQIELDQRDAEMYSEDFSTINALAKFCHEMLPSVVVIAYDEVEVDSLDFIEAVSEEFEYEVGAAYFVMENDNKRRMVMGLDPDWRKRQNKS